MAKCAYHIGNEAIGVCVNCGRFICNECKTVHEGKSYCTPCSDRLFEIAPISRKVTKPNWFARHLNWTAFLTWLALYPISFVAGYILGLIMVSINPYITDELLAELGYLVGILASLLWLLPTNGWILSKKDRSLWWFLILFVPFGWIVFLRLENKSSPEN